MSIDALHSGRRRSPAFERWLSTVEVLTLVCLQVAVVWLGLELLALPWFLPVAAAFFSAELLYFVYVSPVWLHRDRLAERGLGTWRTLFVRTDNVRAAARGFIWLALGGSVLILALGTVWNPGWASRLNSQAVGIRVRSYLISVVVQVLAVVGFGLPRLKSMLMPIPGPHGPGAAVDGAGRLRVAALLALVFGCLHLPSLPLAAMATAYGFVLAFLSLRTPNVAVAACCQFVLGLQVNFVLGITMRVGIFHYHPDVRFLHDIFSWADRALVRLR